MLNPNALNRRPIASRDSTLEHWQSVARHTPLAILTDLDGTLIPFAPTPEEATPDPALLELLRSLTTLPGLRVIVVSGRPHVVLERYFSDPSLWLVAEHGAWCRGQGAWQPTIELDPTPVVRLADRLEALAATHIGARVERKTWSCAVHYRQMRAEARAAFGVELTVILDEFLERHTSFERIDGNAVVEIRAAAARKSFAARWAKQQLGADVRLIGIGDDLTDEHLFAALDALDETVLVQGGMPRDSRARWQVDGVHAARRLLAFIRDTRSGGLAVDLPVAPAPAPAARARPSESLLVVSNRLPDLRSAEPVDRVRRNNVGGLVSALEPILAARHGLWLGWGGRVVPDSDEPSHGVDEGSPALAWFDLTQSSHRDYYNGFCNATLWPLFHSFPSRVVIDDKTYGSYVAVHDTFADAVQRHASPSDTIWVHDYHLLLLARVLRQRGHLGRIGLFLHIPFPSLDILAMLPWAREIVAGMLEFDLVAFHTPSYLANFQACAGGLVGSRSGPDIVEHRGHFTRVSALPIGIFPETFQESPEPALVQEIEDLTRSLGTGQLVLGVDRLDYTKGIPERLLAFGRLLELFPEWRGKVSLIQISVPSRADVPEYVEQRANVEGIVGRVNGQFGEAHWVPIRYLYRGYTRQHLSALYRAARVGYVTPLRDGMNLVAKEYVAAQDPADPGVLVLSEFAGAAYEMKDAILTNPYHVDGMARALDLALRMPLDQRKLRHARCLAVVERTDAQSWAKSFLDALAECPARVDASAALLRGG
jgi:alpha,alpha-trehalose-phosphate synthase [UDP-forming]/trehalose-phosphatase